MTILVTSIIANTLEDVRSRAECAWSGGTDAVEIRIDTFEDDPAQLAAYLRAHKDRTWIVTCRSVAQGGHFPGDTAERVARIIAAARDTDACVDFELADWKRSGNIRRKVLLASAATDGSGHRLILSAHDFNGVPGNLSALADEMASGGQASFAKIAYKSSHICDAFDALDTLHERAVDAGPSSTGKSECVVPTSKAAGNANLSIIAMGEEGVWTRVLAKKLGAFASYCALDAASATAPGQLTLDEMVNRYRWQSIDASTSVYGVIGDPVAHSMSPLLLNRWFRDAGINAVYLPFRVASKGGGLRRFLHGCRKRSWLDIGGFSVTVPHKADALHWVADGVDAMAARIGALNTLVFGGEKITGHNTDSYAAVSSLADALGCSRIDLSGVRVDVLGTGGAACAVLYGLKEVGCTVTLYGRSADRTLRLAEQSGAVAAAWHERLQRDGDVLINCTSVGMWPDVDASPVPADALTGCRLVFDLIYNPLETRLLRDAAVAGIKTLNGLDMFVRQAAVQFELWTGSSPDLQDARRLIEHEINGQRGMPG